MKHIIPFFCFFLLGVKQTQAQQPHFIYLQTDNNQPFYVLLKNKNYSSSSIGYIILPKLENGDYRIKVGFAKSEMPEQDYLLKVKDNDQGYLIKNFGERGSGIFNLQTLAIQYSGEATRQLDAAANAQREAERQKVLLQQQKDSTEKAEAVLAEQRKIAAAAKQKEDAIALEKQRIIDSIKTDGEAKAAAINQKKEADALAKKQAVDNIKAENDAKLAAVKQRKEASTLAKQQSLDSIKNINDSKVAAAKQKREAAALAKQQSLDSIKAVNAAKIAAARQKALAKHEADSITAATNPQTKTQPTVAETPAQKRARLAKEAAQKKEIALAQNQAQTEEQKKQDAIALQNKAAERIRFVSDSLKTVEKNRLQAEQAAAAEEQKKNEAILAKQKADEQAEIEAQRKAYEIAEQNKAAENIRRIQDSLKKSEAEQPVMPVKKDSNLLIANSNIVPSSSKNVNATIIYEPQVLNRMATDSGTLMTYKIPSSKGWDTVTAFIKAPPIEKKEMAVEKPIEKKVVAANNTPQTDGVKFLDIHFKQDSANKSNDLITPVFKENKPEQKAVPLNEAPLKNTTPTATPITNSNCRAEASDKDFYALRKKMVAQNDADNMIIVAKKSMREKCYNTLQIRNLSVLLITDADRYQFLEAAYPFTSDAYNYATLADLLKDNYYGDRFKVMLKR